MGSCFCGFGMGSSSTKKGVDYDDHEENNGLKVAKFLKPRNFWSTKIKKEQSIYRNLAAYNKVLTLEDLILSSPALNGHGGDHSQAIIHGSSRRIHPSFYADSNQEKLLHEPMEINVKIEGSGNGQLDNPVARRSKSGKLKKKVSFRSPEVADVFMLELSPEIYFAE